MRNNKLLVIETIKGKNGGLIFKCLCDCGNYRTLRESDFKKQGSCGCSKRPNFLNRKFGRLTVINGLGAIEGKY